MSKGNTGKVVPVETPDSFDMEEMEDALNSGIEHLPPIVQRRVRSLKNLFKSHLELEKKYNDEVAALDIKYQKLYTPLYQKRESIVKGEYEPTDAEAHIEGEENPPPSDADKDVKGIPKFWLTILQNHPAVSETVTEADEAALVYLQDVRSVSLEGEKKGFVVTFHFAENPFFTDSVLTKTYYLINDDENIFGELVFDHAEGTPIHWKQGKNLTVKTVKKQQKARPSPGGRGGKKAGQTRITTVEEPCESFFSFFTPPVPPARDNEEEEDEEADMLHEALESDFELGCIFKDKLVPHSVLWFTGEALDYEDEYDMDEDYEEEGDDDEEGGDDEDDEEEEEEDEKPRKGANRFVNNQPGRKDGGGAGRGPPSKNPGNAPPQQPECKQQ